VPFKSEAQRRYLWANEPEIARDWTDTYGSRIQKSNGGITNTKQIKGQPHLLAYITPNEVEKLKALGGQETMTKEGIPAYPEFDNYTESSLAGTSSAGSGMTRSEFESGAYGGTGNAGDGVIQQYNTTHHPPIVPKEKPFVPPVKENKNPFKWALNKFQGSWYNRVPNNPKNELGFLNNLYSTNRKAYDNLPQSLKDRYEETIDPANEFSSYKDFDKFSYDDWKDLLAVGDNDFAEYAADMGSPGLKYSGNVGNLEKYVKEYTIHPVTGKKIPKTYGYKEKSGGDGQAAKWQSLGYPSYEAYIAAMSRSGGGGGDTEEDTDWRTTQWDFDTTYPYPNYRDGGRIPAAFGGIMDTATGRRAYGLGSIFKSVGKAVKGVAKAAGKVLKSPIGRAAVIAGLGYGANAGWFGKGMSGWVGGLKDLAGEKKWLGNLLLNDDGGFSPWKLAGIGMTAAPFLGIGSEAKQDTLTDQARRGGSLIDPITGKEALPREMRATLSNAIEEAGNDPTKLAAIQDAYPYLNLGQYLPYASYGVKDGGRIRAQEGGLMSLGGMEKDYRNNGGFVAIGGEERADDVPARLSRNEFVFTADAVRGAGGGDIDKGAEIMENVMKNLEQGGKISEETQGNAGAQQMFGVSERIGEVI